MSSKFKSKKSACRSAVFSLAAIATSCVMFASACAQTSSSTEEDDNAATSVDEQVLPNGNFEYFDDNDGTYLISTPDNWSSSSGSGADATDSMSGIIGTSGDAWAKLTDTSLPETLWKNNALDTDDDNYVDYNGLSPEDLPFANPAAAIIENPDDDKDDDSDDYILSDNPEDTAYISNPYTHLYRWGKKDGKTVLYDNEGNEVEYWTDDEGNYYTSSDMSKDSLIESHVLMIHNYVDDNKQGSETMYSSSTTLTLEANTAGKFTVWVKTSDLYWGSNNDTRTEVEDQRGAYITVEQTVGGNSIDNFSITNINTEKLNAYDEQSGTWEKGNNGWVEYTIYVSACNYASTTVTITVGLGQAENYTVEGYAFFDDLSFTKYYDYNEMVEAAGGEDIFSSQTINTTCSLTSETEDKIFRVDKEIFNQTGSFSDTFEHFSKYQQFFIDLASEAYNDTLTLGTSNLTAGLTVDEDGYISSKNSSDITYRNGVTPTIYPTNVYLPSAMSSIDLSEDVLANLTVTDATSWSSGIGGKYQTKIDEAIRTAVELPGADADGTSTLLMLSAKGAAYESVLSDENNSFFTIGGGEYKIVSFWVKTNDMGGSTAATVTVRQHGKDSNSANFTVDSTTIDTTTINDTEDVYNGWVQCFALVSNTTETDQQFEIVVNFGNTTIKSTTANSYRGGWVAVSNISCVTVNETAYGYADTSTRAASIEISEASETSSNNFDSTFGNGKDIETGTARPANYTGINGDSASVKDIVVETSDYDNTNDYAYAGLINKDYFEKYKTYFADILSSLDISSPLKALFGEDATWNEAVGASSNQPLLIVNTVREFAGQKGIYNYGYYGADQSASSDSYIAVSVKVKVSAGAYATVYLVNTTDKQTLSFETPDYTFWYDNDGNVLKGEPDEDATRPQQRENIAYTLRADGLYEDADGNLYANIYNLDHEYFDEKVTYYDENGNSVNYDNIDAGKIYYADAERTAYAPHYLVTDDGTRVYSYVSGLGNDRVYNYLVNNAADTSLSVKGFDLEVAQPRYTSASAAETPYSFTIDATPADSDLADKWITVNFFIHTGSEAVPYRLEVWSGSRDEKLAKDGVVKGSYVMFDYSAVTIDEDTYNSLVSHYSDEIINEYRDALVGENPDIQFASNEENIAYYEKLAEENGVSVNAYNYTAQYYTYTLYDSQSYVPFNENTADEDERGYNYVYGDYTESLAVLKVEDLSDGSPAMNMFIDYSTVDKDISITSTSDVEEDDTTTTSPGDTNVWLLVSSIVLVVAILVAIGALVARDVLKKRKLNKTAGKNTFNFNKNKRYVRSYVKEHGETRVDDGATEGAEGEQPAQEENTAAETQETQPQTEEDASTEQADEQSEKTEQSSDDDKNN